jgi:hypothetical protein
MLYVTISEEGFLIQLKYVLVLKIKYIMYLCNDQNMSLASVMWLQKQGFAMQQLIG